MMHDSELTHATNSLHTLGSLAVYSTVMDEWVNIYVDSPVRGWEIKRIRSPHRQAVTLMLDFIRHCKGCSGWDVISNVVFIPMKKTYRFNRFITKDTPDFTQQLTIEQLINMFDIIFESTQAEILGVTTIS